MLIERNNDRYVLYFLFIKNCSEMKPNVKEYRLHNFIYRSIKAGNLCLVRKVTKGSTGGF